MTGNRPPFALAQCLFLRGHILMTAPVPPFRAASHAEGDPCALVAVSSGAAAVGAALAQVLHAGLAGWNAPLLPHYGAAAMAVAQAAQAELVKAAKASKAQAKAETGLVWATTHGDGSVVLEPSRQARGTLAFDGLPFRLEASLDAAGETGRALVAAIGFCRGTLGYEDTLPSLVVADIARIGETVLLSPRLPARSDLALPHPQAGEILDMSTARPSALDAALTRALDASRSGEVTNPPARSAGRRAALQALACAAGRPKAAGATAAQWSLAEVAGGGVWLGPIHRTPISAADKAPLWRAVPDAPDGTRAEALLDRMARP